MNNYMAVVEYDGTGYSGFQIQPDGINTIQEEIEKAIFKILQQKVRLRYAGRTDAGVHATHQVINFKSEKELNLYRFKWSINSLLPQDIAVKEINKVSCSFDARRDAKFREYSYFVVNGNYQSVFLKKYSILFVEKINVNLMKKAADMVVGVRDFKSFCNRDDDKSKNTLRNMISLTINKNKDSLIIFKMSANSFLYNMARIIVGTLLEIGCGKRDIESIKKAITLGDRNLTGKTAPAKGLFLTNVVY